MASSLREALIASGVIKPAASQEPQGYKPKDVVGRVLPSDLPKAPSKPKKQTPLSLSRKPQQRKHPDTPESLLLPKKPLYCPLCGQRVKSGKLLEHKNQVHGETIMAQSTVRTAPLYQERALFVRGGGTGLKK